MSNYTKSTNFATKDNLTPGDPLKVVRGTEIDTEFNNIATAVATKTDNSAAAITGGSITGITDLAIADGGTGASTATAALNNLLPSQTGNATKYLQTDGGNASWDAISLSTSDITGTLAVANGGTGVTSSTGTGSVVLSNSPTLVTPALGTPASGTLTNATGLPISTGVSGLGTGIATFLGTPSSANLASAVSDETGSGALVFANSPTLVTPALGTPSSGVLTNATGLPISTGVSGLGTGVATFLATPSSANLISAVTDETGTGSLVFATSPTLVTPALGTPSALVGTNITGTASGLTAGNVTTNANLTGAVTSVGNATSLGSFSSANLLGALTDETGTGSAVFATSPTLVTPILGTPTSATLTNATGLPISTGVSGLGTGIATALAVNTGSAGAPILFNGALGTPSSGTVTNLTGTASININGTVGATTATTGAFTTVTASSTATATSFIPSSSTVPTNGLFLPAANTLGLGTNSTEKVRVTSDGYLLVGTTYGSGVNIVGTNPFLLVNRNIMAFRDTVNATGPTFNLLKTRAALGVFGIVSNGDTLGQINFAGDNGVDYSSQGAQIVASVDGVPSSTSMAGRLVFSTTPSASITPQERVRIDSSGNVGIGTTSPTEKLHVSSSSEVVSRFARSGGSNALVLIQDPTTTTAPYIASYGNSMAFGSYGGSEYGRFLSTGFLGLGTNSPSTKLHIASGAVTIANGSGATQALLISGNDPANAGITLSNTTGPRLWSIIAGNTTVNNTDFTIRDGTAGATRLVIPSTGGIQSVNSISVGNATPTTSGAGITFPATQSASSDANTLDDYEEGTWTPNDQSGASLSLTTSNGRYTKIGNMVYCSATITYPTTASGSVARVGGLPFTSIASSVYGGYIRYTDSGLSFSIAQVAGSANFEFYTSVGAAQTNVSLSTKRVDVNIMYQV